MAESFYTARGYVVFFKVLIGLNVPVLALLVLGSFDNPMGWWLVAGLTGLVGFVGGLAKTEARSPLLEIDGLTLRIRAGFFPFLRHVEVRLSDLEPFRVEQDSISLVLLRKDGEPWLQEGFRPILAPGRRRLQLPLVALDPAGRARLRDVVRTFATEAATST